jgi:predicted ferric reductase
MKRSLQGAFWIGVYLFLVGAPLFMLLVGPTPAGRSFWREFSVAIGFAGLAIMGFQFLITARFRHIELPYGMDIVYHFHRQISWVALALILGHVVILFVENPRMMRMLNVFTASWRARCGVASIVALLLLVITSIWRRQLRLEYETWRVAHGILATLAVAFAMAHIVLVNHYVELPWKRALWIGLTVFWIGLLLYVRIVKPVMMLRRPYRVTDVHPERGGAYTLTLAPEGHAGFRFKPGQFGWLSLWNGPFAIMEHPFSFSASAEPAGQVAFTIKEAGDFTATIEHAKPGQRAYLDGPYGAFSFERHQAPGFVFLAGGVGVTPIFSMLRTLAERRDRRPLLFFYGSNSWDEIIFREEIAALQERLDLTLVHVLTHPPAGWTGETGLIDASLLDRHLPQDRNSREYFICGSDPMMDAVESALGKLGVSLEHIHSERYNFV